MYWSLINNDESVLSFLAADEKDLVRRSNEFVLVKSDLMAAEVE